jgi:hypothetical protein
MDFKTALSGCGAADVSTKELTAGAKINNLFNERSAKKLICKRKSNYLLIFFLFHVSLWSEIIKNAYDENAKIKGEILLAIQNVHGINVGSKLSINKMA